MEPDSYEYTQFCKFLENEQSLEAKAMLQELKNMDYNHLYSEFKTNLLYNLFFQAYNTKKSAELEKLELWIVANNAQYRLSNQETEGRIQLTFWLPDKTVQHFNTSYQNLFRMLNESNKDYYSPESL